MMDPVRAATAIRAPPHPVSHACACSAVPAYPKTNAYVFYSGHTPSTTRQNRPLSPSTSSTRSVPCSAGSTIHHRPRDYMHPHALIHTPGRAGPPAHTLLPSFMPFVEGIHPLLPANAAVPRPRLLNKVGVLWDWEEHLRPPTLLGAPPQRIKLHN